MLKHRYFISYFSTTLLYLVFGGLFYYLQEHHLVAAHKSEEKFLNMTLSAFVPEEIPPVEQKEEEIKKEEPPVEKEPENKERETKEKIVPEPIVKKTVPKPVVKKIKKKSKVKKKTKKFKKKKTRTRTSAKRSKTKRPTTRRSKSSKAEKNKFLATIRAKINQHKTYPRVAKKRRMQGSVKVKFTILRSGKVGNISVRGPKVFHNSARKAVKRAFPVSTKHASISLPASINITLRYQIR